MTERGSFFDTQSVLNETAVRENLRRDFGSGTVVDNLINQARKQGKGSMAYNVMLGNLTNRYMKDRRISRAQAKLLAERQLSTTILTGKDKEDFIRQEIEGDAMALSADARQLTMGGSSMFERVVNRLNKTGLDTPIATLAASLLPGGASVFSDVNKITDPDFFNKVFNPANEADFRKRLVEQFVGFGGFRDERLNSVLATSQAVSGVRFMNRGQMDTLAGLSGMIGQDKDAAMKILEGMGITDMKAFRKMMRGGKGDMASFIENLNQATGSNFKTSDITDPRIMEAFGAFISVDDSDASNRFRSMLQRSGRIMEQAGGKFDKIDMSGELGQILAKVINGGQITDADIKKFPELRQLKDSFTNVRAAAKTVRREESAIQRRRFNETAESIAMLGEDEATQMLRMDMSDKERDAILKEIGATGGRQQELVNEVLNAITEKGGGDFKKVARLLGGGKVDPMQALRALVSVDKDGILGEAIKGIEANREARAVETQLKAITEKITQFVDTILERIKGVDLGELLTQKKATGLVED